MNKRIQKSGHFYREQSKRRKNEDESNKNTLSGMFKKMEASVNDTNKSDDESTAANSSISQKETTATISSISQHETEVAAENVFDHEMEVEASTNIDVKDPSTWPKESSNKLRDHIVDSVDCFPTFGSDFTFPISKGRRFSPKLFYSIAPNETN